MGIESALLVQGVGAGVSAYGAYSNSKAGETAYGMQAQVATNNATLAGWQAQDAIKRGEKAVTATRMRTNQLKGSQRARMAANGVDLGVGSALQVLTDTDQFGEIDVNTITDNAAREAWAIRNQANGFTNEAMLMQSRADAENPAMAAGTSLLTSAGKVAANWYGSKTPKPAATARRGHDTFGEGQY